MQRWSRSRRRQTDLLVRPPCTSRDERGWVNRFVDPVEQVERLADLWRRGLISRQEFEREKSKVFDG